MEENRIECPYCKSTNVELVEDDVCFDEIIYAHRCKDCGRKF